MISFEGPQLRFQRFSYLLDVFSSCFLEDLISYEITILLLVFSSKISRRSFFLSRHRIYLNNFDLSRISITMYIQYNSSIFNSVSVVSCFDINAVLYCNLLFHLEWVFLWGFCALNKYKRWRHWYFCFSLSIFLRQLQLGYVSFLVEIKKLPKCGLASLVPALFKL